MYRTNDPRFRRRLNELGQTLESANETAQSSIYIFGQNYIKPCFESVTSCVTSCVESSCPSLIPQQRERLRRQRGRARSAGRAELNFDFYDDWDEEENEGLLGWGNDEFDRLVGAGGGSNTIGAGYGTATPAVATQPGRQRGMSYPQKVSKRKALVLPQEGDADTTLIAHTSFFGKLFGGRSLRYKPSAADLQDHPGTMRLARDITEGEALLDELDEDGPSSRRRRQRARSGTVGSADTRDSYSSRGDIFPSDEEELDDAVPLDDEFAMVLERRMTGSGMESTEDNSSGRRSPSAPAVATRGKRPSASSRTSRASTRRTFSSRSSRSGKGGRGRASSGAVDAGDLAQSQELAKPDESGLEPIVVPSLSELKLEEQDLEREEEAVVERRRQEAQRLAFERGLAAVSAPVTDEELPSKEASPRDSSTPIDTLARNAADEYLPR